jgi:hypothetical protein
MDYEILIKGYKKILSRIYSPEPYYRRVREFLREYRPSQRKAFRFNFSYVVITGSSFCGLYSGAPNFSIWPLLLPFTDSISERFSEIIYEIFERKGEKQKGER